MATENDNWPSFSMPTGDGTPSEPAPATPPSASEPGGASPPAAAAPAQPGAPAPSTPTPADPSPGEMLPKYRYDELNARYEATAKQVEQLTGLLTRALALQQTPPQPGEPPDPRKERIRAELLDAMPDLRATLDFFQQKKAEIEQTIERAKQLGGYVEAQSAREKAEWDAYAKRSVEAVYDAVSPYLLGKGKTGKDLDPDRQQAIVDQYIAWIGKQPDRVARYNSQDSTLRDEFVKFFVQQWVDPVRRGSSAELARGARTVQNLPVAGGAGAVLGTPPAKPNNEDEDAVFKRGWALAQQLANS